MVDFWMWEYDYGHNLDPKCADCSSWNELSAAITGFKQLLNFGAYSYPDIGGIIMFAVAAISLIILAFIEFRKAKTA